LSDGERVPHIIANYIELSRPNFPLHPVLCALCIDAFSIDTPQSISASLSDTPASGKERSCCTANSAAHRSSGFASEADYSPHGLDLCEL
jgi:hypothetical protein